MGAPPPSAPDAGHRWQHLAALSRRLAEDTLDLAAVLQTTVVQLSAMVGDSCTITLRDADDILHPVARFHPNPEALALIDAIQQQATIRVGEGLAGSVAASGQPLLIAEISLDESRRRVNPEFAAYLERFQPHAYMILPLRSRGVTLGTLGLSRDRTPAPYTPDDLVFMQEVSDRVALTIDNAQLYQQLQIANQALVQEVQEHRGANMQLSAQLAEQRRLDQALRDAMHTAEQANQAKGLFLSRMSHELRTPLNAILGFAQLLQLDLADPGHQESVQYILKSGRHLLTLITEVLDVARIDAGHMHLELAALPLLPVLLDSVAMVLPLASARTITITINNDTLAPWTIVADEQRLKQVVLNLLANAINYTPAGGTIHLSGARQEDGIALQIVDSGVGIPAERLDELFLPFQRLGADQTSIPGTGLGLAITRRLVEAMRGTITLSSVVGRGTTVTVVVPQAPSAAPLPQRPASAPAHRRPLPPAQLLIIEDIASNIRLLERVFAPMPGIVLSTAATGAAGLAMALATAPALILLDLHLPDGHGEHVLAQLQAHPATCQIPVVIISADATPGPQERLLALGARAYLTKPIETDRLIDTIAALLGDTDPPRTGERAP